MKKFKINPELWFCTIPGFGRVCKNDILVGKQYQKYVPQFLVEIVEDKVSQEKDSMGIMKHVVNVVSEKVNVIEEDVVYNFQVMPESLCLDPIQEIKFEETKEEGKPEEKKKKAGRPKKA